MQIPPETLAESQVAYRQIQRYQNSSSSPVLFVYLSVILLVGPILKHSLEEVLWVIFIVIFFGFFHFYQRRSMRKKADDAQKHLDFLRDKYGLEIDVVA